MEINLIDRFDNQSRVSILKIVFVLFIFCTISFDGANIIISTPIKILKNGDTVCVEDEICSYYDAKDLPCKWDRESPYHIIQVFNDTGIPFAVIRKNDIGSHQVIATKYLYKN